MRSAKNSTFVGVCMKHIIQTLAHTRHLLMIASFSAVTIVGCGGDGAAGGTARAWVSPVVSSTLTATVSPSRVSGVAPLSVFFDATATTSTRIANPLQSIDYRWDFGDTAGGNWLIGSRVSVSRNTATGPVASHVFKSPGDYTVNLMVNDGGSSRIVPIQITVTDPNVVFASSTMCVSAIGNFTGCPVGSAQLTTTDYEAAVRTNQATHKRLLFRRGDTFLPSANGAARINTSGPGIIGAYGDGAAPKWIPETGYPALYLSSQSTAGISDWRVMDIEIDGQDRFTAGVSGDGGIDQVLLLGLNIHNVSNGIVMSASILDGANADGNPQHSGHTLWDQFAVVGTAVKDINNGVQAGGMVGAYISATKFTFMGNTMDVGGGGEHVLRTPYIGRGVVSNNILANPANSKHCWQLHAPGQANTGVVGGGLYTEHVEAAENTFVGGVTPWAVFVGPQNTAVDERLRNLTFERNYFVAGTGTVSGLMFRGPVSSIMVRNNIVNLSGSAAGAVEAYAVGDGGVGPRPTDIAFLNNTAYSSVASQFTGISIGTVSTNVKVQGNLAYAPAATTAQMLSGTGASGLLATNNSTDLQVIASPSFVSVAAVNARTVGATDFRIATGSYAIGTGIELQASTSDFFVAGRGARDIGAVLH